MEVIALVGPSGTGKSHRALVVAHEQKADAIIDDGILIKDGKIIAGHSAKREANRVMAVKRAIFILEDHAREVREAILKVHPNKILILGTSENMVHKIAKILGLAAITKMIRIEDIASLEEIEKAQFCRLKEGKHIIPVPTIELKPHFSGYLIDPMEIFFKKPRAKRRRLGEKSIVRPMFSYYGKLSISDAAIIDIVREVVKHAIHFGRAYHIKVYRVRRTEEDKGLKISLRIALPYGISLPAAVQNQQEEIKAAVELMTAMNVYQVDIEVASLLLQEER